MRDEFGCDYCRDDQNRVYGHVTQIGSDETRQMILLRCPRCGALYENTAAGPDATRRLTPDEAARFFPGHGELHQGMQESSRRRLEIHGRRVVVGGQAHSGWLPQGAASPPATRTEEVIADFLIEEDEHGAMLYCSVRGGPSWDTWRESVDGAIEQAHASWGIEPQEWASRQ